MEDNTLAVIKVVKNNNYTIMSNYHLRDMNLSNKTRGLLATMLSLPPNWNFTIEGLSAICKDGVDSIRSQLQELEKYGYLVRVRYRNEKGHLKGTEFFIYEEPQQNKPIDEKPMLENPILVPPAQVKPTQDNLTQTSKEIINKEKSKQEDDEEEVEEEVEFDEETGEVKEKPAKRRTKEEEIDPDERVIIASIEELNEAASLRKEEQAKKKEQMKNEVVEEQPIKMPEINLNPDVRPMSDYKLPTLDLLKKTKTKNNLNEESIRATGELLITVLNDFGIEGVSIVDIHVGPSVTQYELSIKTGTKLSRILSINKEISLALAKKDVRIQAPIPATNKCGVLSISANFVSPMIFLPRATNSLELALFNGAFSNTSLNPTG